MFTIRGYLEGEVLIERQLDALENRISDLTPAWPAVLATFRAIQRAAFSSEGASTGQPWQPLADSTKRQRASQGFPPEHPILVRTHTLERALTSDSGASYTVEMPRYFAVVVDLDYFKFHQSNQPRNVLPRRAPISLTQDDKYRVMHPIRLYVRGLEPNSGGVQ